MTPEAGRRRVRGVPEEGRPSANDRFKESFRSWLAGGIILATLAHVALFELFPTMRTADLASGASVIEAVELPPEVEVPPPPEPIARPATPRVASAVDLDEEVTIARTSFEANPPERLPPPPRAGVRERPEDRPAFIPYDVPPELKNPGEVQRVLSRTYPPALRESGTGGRVVLWLYVDETGTVQRTRVFRSSGYDALDEAARKVARQMEFTPALNRDRRTAVWVQQAIDFEVA